MQLLLVRHAKAGSRTDWRGPDHERPLTKKGREQAEALVRHLGAFEVSRLLSSPYVRCVQTVEPLGATLGIAIETSPALAEGRVTAAVRLARDLAAFDGRTGVVLCTHGDVIPELVFALAGLDGVDLPREPRWDKAATWVLEAAAGRVVRASYVPPPS